MKFDYFSGTFSTFNVAEYSAEEISFLKKIIKFNDSHYVNTYTDVAAAGVDPFQHFLSYGAGEARTPCAVQGGSSDLLSLIGFDQDFYATKYPDVVGDLLNHFVECGISESRIPYDLYKNVPDEEFCQKYVKSMGISFKVSLEEPICIQIFEDYIDEYWENAEQMGLGRRSFRNNFWIVLAIMALRRGWFAVAKAAYNFFFNYYVPMSLLGNAKGMVIETGRIHGIVDYAKRTGLPLMELPVADKVLVPTPVFLNRPADPQPDEWHELPRPHYVQLRNVTIMGETSLIRVGTHDYLYDYLDEHGERTAEIKSQMIMHNINGNCAVRSRPTVAKVAEAFSLLHDHSHNYFHWLLEVLPRLLLARDRGLVDDIPLLVQERIAPQMEELLKLIFGKPPSLIKIGPGYNVEVGKLHLVTDICHNEVHTRHLPDRRDILLSQTAIQLLRKAVAPLMRQGVKQFERVLIARQNVAFRRLVNREALELVLKERGYATFDPGAATFSQQVQVFSNARFIICEAGAAQANLVFCQPGATICILVNGCAFSNYYYLMEFGHLLGLRVRLVECMRLEGTHELGVQDDMIVHLSELETYLTELEAGDDDRPDAAVEVTQFHQTAA